MSHINNNPTESPVAVMSIVPVKTVEDLVSNAASLPAGSTLYVNPGTYTLTSATGPLIVGNGVTIRGAGEEQTIITEDGSLADSLIKMVNTPVGTYNIGALAAWAITGTTDTAAEAGNINDGDILYFEDSAAAEKMVALANGAGNPGTGAFNFFYEATTGFDAASTMKVYNTYSSDITIENLTLLGDGANTTNGIEITGGKNICVRNVKIRNLIGYGLLLSACLDSTFVAKCYDSSLATYVVGGLTDCVLDIKSLNCASANNCVVILYVYYSTVSVKTFGATPGDSVINFKRSHSNITRFISSTPTSVRSLILESSDENIVEASLRGTLTNSGTGNSLLAT